MFSRWILVPLVCLIPSLLLPAAARAITIGELVSSGGSFSSADGTVSFSDFSASSQFSLFPLDDVGVSALDSGLLLDDTPLMGFEGTTASWEIAFTVTATSGFGLTGTSIGFTGRRLSDFDPALSDVLLAATTSVGVSIIDTTPGAGAFGDQAFSAHGDLDGSSTLRIELLLEAENFETGGVIPGEGVASLWAFRQDFSLGPAIPEPSAALLFGIGLLVARAGALSASGRSRADFASTSRARGMGHRRGTG